MRRFDTINQAIATDRTTRSNLPTPMPIFVVYETAFAGVDGRLIFRADVYGRDVQIGQYLNPERRAVVECGAPGRRGADFCHPGSEGAYSLGSVRAISQATRGPSAELGAAVVAAAVAAAVGAEAEAEQIARSRSRRRCLCSSNQKNSCWGSSRH